MTLSFLKYEKPALPHQIRWLVILQLREMREGKLDYFTRDRSCQELSQPNTGLYGSIPKNRTIIPFTPIFLKGLALLLPTARTK